MADNEAIGPGHPAHDVPSSLTGAARVMVIEDVEPLRCLAGESLRRAGFLVVTLSAGEDAVALVREADFRFDAVLLDLSLPRLSGVETCHILNELMPDV